tara:strand:+ start:406 stop:660 length:255 start_codon:yes stop_codon:yes gene_type:complete
MKKKEKIKGWKVKFQMVVKAKNKTEVKKITREYFKKMPLFSTYESADNKFYIDTYMQPRKKKKEFKIPYAEIIEHKDGSVDVIF